MNYHTQAFDRVQDLKSLALFRHFNQQRNAAVVQSVVISVVGLEGTGGGVVDGDEARFVDAAVAKQMKDAGGAQGGEFQLEENSRV